MINKDENSRPQKCTSSLLCGNDSEAPMIFMNMLVACCIGVEIVNNFFQRQRGAVGKEKLLANCSFFAVRLYLYVPRENNCMIQCNDLFLLVMVSYLKFKKIQSFSVFWLWCFIYNYCSKKRQNVVSLCSNMQFLFLFLWWTFQFYNYQLVQCN